MAREFMTNDEIVIEARKRLAQGQWDYLVGGSESETTMRRNRLAFDRWAFRPRVLVDVSKVDPSTTFLGQKLRLPVLLAPVGSLTSFTPDGAKAAAEAAEAFGIMQVVSSVTGHSLEEVGGASTAPKVFQLYIRGDMDWIKPWIDRLKKAGYLGLTITVDTAVGSRRERPLITRYQGTTGGRRLGAVADERRWAAGVTWDTIDAIKAALGDAPLLVKGIATAEDADLAVRHGVDVVWVSNHGGRQLDHGLGAMDTLPEITKAVNGRARVILDGGVQRGTDILKALALGCDAVAVGKLQGWGLAADGKDGLVRVLEILEDEMTSAMGLMGITAVNQLSPNYVTRGEMVTPPHEMSGWVNIPGTGRIG